MINVTDIEKRVDKAIAAPTPVDMELGGVRLENLGQVMEFAKLMAVSGVAVPPWLRSNVGGCLAICSRAMRWGMDPFAVAEQSYLAKGKGGEEHVAFMAQLVHAVVTAHAPLKGRLRTEIIGQGDERRCKVWGTFKGETKPHEYTSETLGKKIAAIGHNDKGQIRGSPLWTSDPEVQLRYSAVRQWCRLHSSDTILGVYTPDELEEAPESTISSLSQRLRDAKLAHVGERGFDPAHVAKVIEGEAQETEHEDHDRRTDQAGDGRRTMDPETRPGRDHEQKASTARGQKPQAPGAHAARHRAAREETQDNEDLFPPDRPKATYRAPKRKR
jgi:RecT family